MEESFASLAGVFDQRHQQRFGYVRTGKPLEVVGIWVEGSSPEPAWQIQQSADEETMPRRGGDAASDARHAHRMVSRGRWQTGSRWLHSEFAPGAYVDGPALIQHSGSTTIVEAGWRGQRRSDGIWILERRTEDVTEAAVPDATASDVDPVLRDVLAQRIAAIADQMGIVLEQTAISVNVKQRRDFSCAVFDRTGELIANAPHVPVHLGAMGRTVKAMIDAFPEMRSGDCYVTNDPYRGGSHLPDVTVVTPVFAAGHRSDAAPMATSAGTTPDFFVASRAHHAEIGGIAPGSMAPTSTRLGEEGVVIPPMKLLDAGRDVSAAVEMLLRSGPYPSRSVAENMADLAAQQAANMRGAVAMQELAREVGLARLQRALAAILDAAESKTRRWIETLDDRIYHHRDCMDDGTPIEVALRKQKVDGRDALRIDFHGTGPTSSGNLNANPGIVHAAVLYSVRCAIADTMPLNSGVMRALECVIPEGILNPRCSGPQSEWPAVAGGNVETSQRIVDCLFGALGLGAASQGTMNNFLFGNASFGYYETIGGGTGACLLGNGASAVHSHMTNTRLTDVEVLESRYPVRLVQFAIRRGSGGAGLHRGGDGMIREVLALEPLEVSLVTGRRAPYRPFGLSGGEDGASGENWWIHGDGRQERLPHACQLRIAAGDAIRILTPGGGGFGIRDAAMDTSSD
jgi:5-oxoprolinase (ATP-hydrolysing)